MRLNILVAASLAAVLAGCGAEPAGSQPAASATATAPVAPVDATAEAFVRSLYAVDQGGTARRVEDGAVPPRVGGAMWSARTAALIAESEALGTPGEYAYFEADPVCDCQDDGGMVLTSVAMTPRGADRADATVVLTWTMARPAEVKRQTFNLVQEAGGWRIDDIQRDQSGSFPQPPLVQDITRWIAETKATPAA